MPVQQPMPIEQPTPFKQQWPVHATLQQQSPREPFHVSITREGPATITRVVADLMIFVKFELEENKELVGLVFKPNKIEGYGGETLESLNLVVGAHIPTIVWDQDTFLVQRVEIERFGGKTPPTAASA
jgi:hypothetical protein